MRRIKILDTTLRDGEQAPGALFKAEDKLAVAHALADSGIDIIEIGMPLSSKPIEYKTAKRIAKEVVGPTICILCRAVVHDISDGFNAISANPNTRIHVFIGTSDIHIDAKFRNKGKTLAERRDWVLSSAVKSVKHARSLCPSVEFTPEDTTRTDLDYLVKICEAVIEAGATVINIADTVGDSDGEALTRGIRLLRQRVRGIENVELSVHCHDDHGLATANTLAAIAASVDQVETTFNSMGERAGNCSLEELVANLISRPKYGVDFRFDPKQIGPLSQMIAELSGFTIAPNKPIAGGNAYSHASGVHQHGVSIDPRTYESSDPASFGIDPDQKFVLTKLSGHHGVRARLRQLNVELDEQQFAQVYAEVIRKANQKNCVSNAELLAIVGDIHGRPEAKYQLVGYRAVIDKAGGPGHSVKFDLLIDGVPTDALHSGEKAGIVDVLFCALQKATGVKVELMNYELKAKSSGQDALAECELTLRRTSDGTEALGVGVDADITTATVLAYLDALNRLSEAAISAPVAECEPKALAASGA